MREEFAIIKLPEHVKLPDNDSIGVTCAALDNTSVEFAVLWKFVRRKDGRCDGGKRLATANWP